MKNKFQNSRDITNASGEWVDCPRNTIENMVHSKVNLQRRRLITKVGIGSVAVLTSVVTGASIYRQLGFGQKNNPPRVTVQLMACNEVQKLYPAFVDNSLDCGKRQSLVAHLKKCRSCCRELDVVDVHKLEA